MGKRNERHESSAGKNKCLDGGTSTIVCIDLFCGAGGLTRGLRDAGIRVVKGVDVDETAKETYERNNPGAEFVQTDIRKISPDDILGGVDRSGRLMLAGCAPCQPFSAQNPNTRKKDERTSLIHSFGSLVSKILPDFVMIENVPGFRKASNPYHAMFVTMLEELGYVFDEDVLNAAAYGVPQTRSRYVLVASRLGPIRLPEQTHGPSKLRFRTVRDKISHLPEIAAGEISAEIINHSSSKLSKVNTRRIRRTSHDGGSRTGLPPSLRLPCHVRHSGHTDVYGRMWWDRPSPTLTCKCTSLSNGRFGHPEQDRAISVREAALIQTFPANYVFYSGHTANTRHIGNAVPVLLAKRIGQAVMKASRLAC